MEKNYKFEEINPVPTESIRINPMFNELDSDEDEKKEEFDMLKPEIPTGKRENEYRSDFDSDVGYHEEENTELDYSEDELYDDEEDLPDEDEEDLPDEDEEDGDDASDENEEADDLPEEIDVEELAKSGDRYAAGYQLIGKRPNDFRSKHKGLFKREGSFIMRLVDKLVAKIYNKTQNGLLGDFFTSYDRLDEECEKSAILSCPSKVSSLIKKKRKTKVKEKIIVDDITGEEVAKIREKSSKKRSPLKKTVDMLEKSVLLNSLERFLSILLYLPMATYGALLLSAGITTILVQSAKGFWFPETFSVLCLILGVAYTLVAMITIFAGDTTLAHYLCESRIGSFILVSVFGLFKKNIDTEKKVPKYRFWAFLLGVGIGALSSVVSAVSIFIVIATLIVAAGIANNPESGVVIVTFMLPFAPVLANGRNYMYLLIFYVFLAWIFKLVRRQRRAKIGSLDGWVLLFALFVFVTAIVSVDRSEAFYHALSLVIPMIAFFLATNLLNSRVWLARAASAMMLSGFVVAAYGIYEWVMQGIKDSWNFEKLLDNNINSMMGTPETLSAYLLVIFCFALSGVSQKNTRGIRLLSASIMLPVIACVIFTMDIFAWMVLVACIMIYLLIRSKKNAASTFAVLAMILFVLYLVSDILPGYLTGIAGENITGRLEVMHVTVSMVGKYAVTGIGLGETVFENIYNSLSQTGVVSVSNGGNLLLEILIRFGIVGVVFIIGIVIMVYRQAFSTYKTVSVRRYASVYSIASITAFTALLMISGMSYIWKDFSIAYTFWTIAGFVCAARKIAVFENAAVSENSALDIKLPISTFRKKVKKTK